MLERRGPVGLGFRAMTLLMIEAIALTAVVVLRWLNQYFADLTIDETGSIFLAITFCMLLGLVFTELPAGDKHTFTRLGLATFCRTGLPLLVVIVISKYSLSPSKVQPIVAAGVFYAVGHFSVMILSTLPLKPQRP